MLNFIKSNILGFLHKSLITQMFSWNLLGAKLQYYTTITWALK